MTQMLGVPKEDVIGRGLDEPAWGTATVAGTPLPASELPFSKALQAGTPVFDSELHAAKPDGTRVVLSVNSAPLRDESGAVVGAISTVTNITGRKMVEKLLQESERRFRELLESVDLIALVHDAQGHITFVNDALLNCTGWAWSDVIHKNWFDLFVPPEARLEVTNIFFNAVSDGSFPSHYENAIVTKDGAKRIIRFSNLVLRDPSGAIVGSASIGEDITDRKRMEVALQESERRYRVLAESARDSIYIRDVNGVLLYANDYVAQTLERLKDELIGRSIDETYLQEEAEALEGYYGKVIATGEPIHFDVELSFFGKKHWLDIRLVPLTDDAGNVESVMRISRDITNRKNMEKALQESEARFRKVFEGSPHSMCLVDLDLRFISVNQKLARQLGCDEDELVGLPISARIRPDDAGKHLQQAQHLIGGDVAYYGMELRFIRSNGEPLTVSFTGSLISDDQGSPLCIFGLAEKTNP